MYVSMRYLLLNHILLFTSRSVKPLYVIFDAFILSCICLRKCLTYHLNKPLVLLPRIISTWPTEHYETIPLRLSYICLSLFRLSVLYVDEYLRQLSACISLSVNISYVICLSLRILPSISTYLYSTPL